MALTPLALSALGLLVERPMHPYEMYQLLLERHEDRFVKVRPGSLYHSVERLQGRQARRGPPAPSARATAPSARRTRSPKRAATRSPPASASCSSSPYASIRTSRSRLSEAHNLPADEADRRPHAATPTRSTTTSPRSTQLLQDRSSHEGIAEAYWLGGDYILHHDGRPARLDPHLHHPHREQGPHMATTPGLTNRPARRLQAVARPLGHGHRLLHDPASTTRSCPSRRPRSPEDLHADVNNVIWVTSAYLLAYAVPLLVTGRLGDRFGPKNVYLVGLTIFTLASLWCGLTGSIEMLIVARVVQGIGASLITPQTMAVITRTFPPAKRGSAMALWGATAGVATLVGPILGGVLVDAPRLGVDLLHQRAGRHHRLRPRRAPRARPPDAHAHASTGSASR